MSGSFVDIVYTTTTEERSNAVTPVRHTYNKHLVYKPPRRFAPCRLNFDAPLFSITTGILQSPLPSRPHSWLPSLLTLPCLPYTSFLSPLSPLPFPSFPATPFFHLFLPTPPIYAHTAAPSPALSLRALLPTTTPMT